MNIYKLYFIYEHLIDLSLHLQYFEHTFLNYLLEILGIYSTTNLAVKLNNIHLYQYQEMSIH